MGKKKKTPRNKKHQPFAPVFQNLKKGLPFELGFNIRKQETMFSVLSSVVCLSLLQFHASPPKKYQSVRLAKLEMTIHLKISMDATPKKDLGCTHLLLSSFLCTNEYVRYIKKKAFTGTSEIKDFKGFIHGYS